MTVDETLKQQLDDFRTDFYRLRAEISKVIVGQQEILDDMLISLVAGGHVLLEGVPGLGKTLTVRTLADALHLDFHRIQFTPDLMPADLIGTNVIAEMPDGRKVFEFQKGPLFANVLLADEINRATPKTQSALLEAMQEHSVTVAGITHRLSEPFFVMATQNPLEMEGTYPLPEAQLDRFFCKLLVKYPHVRDLEKILDRTTESQKPQAEAVMTGERVLQMSALARQIPISEEVRRYGIALVVATHPEHELATAATKKYVRYGASPRGLQALVLGAKIRAILDSRYHVSRDDLRETALPVLRHRLILNFEGQAEGIQVDDVLEKIISGIAEDALAAA
ncbi:AAA family ATPase [Roseimaritima ulvae]|uniref:ATPase family associated with various cellular activities (AAA) n=1 Tax=Roseimaritima ulvae TaxID=980254 RepID=A0A5B9QTY2_9BACT|nr:MoxR family ATPase [Roseimaritima ulvae]QEG41409.1 ATPase family associated with various cellular activities (AAA) [Roseimaritima ulvae]